MEIREVDSKKNQEMLSTLLENYSQSQNKNIPVFEKKEISLAAYDGATFLGGITGEIFWNHLHVSLLAIHPDNQKGGVGSRLLEQIELIARENNCTLILLETMSWQAPKFYPKHGYTLFGTVEDYPIKGEAQYSFQKRLS
ncbi:GNAT family N-acetyltransferase [Carnobacterium maltaromaticum]|uniref:GNAT family N-acetyltransferase n=1 Tax=Carnobacterium maltaromaticum TaxID=2751 RepID=UPI0039AF84DB